MSATTWGMTADRGADWRDDARCRDIDTDNFYPLGIGHPGDPQTEMAKAFCGPCEVREQCLEWAITHNEQWGVWGGLRPYERRQLARDRVTAEQFPPIQELVRELPGVVPSRVHPRGRRRKAVAVR